MTANEIDSPDFHKMILGYLEHSNEMGLGVHATTGTRSHHLSFLAAMNLEKNLQKPTTVQEQVVLLVCNGLILLRYFVPQASRF